MKNVNHKNSQLVTLDSKALKQIQGGHARGHARPNPTPENVKHGEDSGRISQ
jgi:hypothetical protein